MLMFQNVSNFFSLAKSVVNSKDSHHRADDHTYALYYMPKVLPCSTLILKRPSRFYKVV